MYPCRSLLRFILLLSCLGMPLKGYASSSKKKPRIGKAKPLVIPAKKLINTVAVNQVEPSRASEAKGFPSVRIRKRQANGPLQKNDRWPPIKLEQVNTGEKLTLRLYDKRGRPVKSSLRRIWHILRCHLTSRERPIHWRLIRSLYQVSQHYPGRAIQIYSGLRAKQVASLPHSNHVKGRALDFRVQGISNQKLRDYLMTTFKPCGVGYYPNGPFVHFDIREDQSAFWVDYSRKGEPAEYAADPYDVLRKERGAGQMGKAAIGLNRETSSESTTSRANRLQSGNADTAALPTPEEKGLSVGKTKAGRSEPLRGVGTVEKRGSAAAEDVSEAATDQDSISHHPKKEGSPLPDDEEKGLAAPPRNGVGERGEVAP